MPAGLRVRAIIRRACRFAGGQILGQLYRGSFSVPPPLFFVSKRYTKTEKVRNVARNQFAEIQINGVVKPFSRGNTNFAK